jgi:hypothetical protein
VVSVVSGEGNKAALTTTSTTRRRRSYVEDAVEGGSRQNIHTYLYVN